MRDRFWIELLLFRVKMKNVAFLLALNLCHIDYRDTHFEHLHMIATEFRITYISMWFWLLSWEA